MISVIVFLFSLFGFLILWGTILWIFKKGWRDAFVSAALYYSVFLFVLSEGLSLFNCLNFWAILIGWIIYDIVLITYLYSKLKKNLSLNILQKNFHLPRSWYFYFIGFILIITFFIAIAYPPNNWDSMTYHLPRIEHWIQNGNLNHYYTSNMRQLAYAPFAEIAILHSRVLSNNDWLMNLVQWFAFVGTIIVVSKIAARYGLDKKYQLVAGLFFATLPMAILQASSTQTDLIVAFWLVCLADRFLLWKEDRTFRLAVEFGIALGLAILTKGSAYPIAFPFVVMFGFTCVKQYRKYLLYGVCAALICLMLNFPHYVRNFISYDNPIHTNGETMSVPTPKSFFIGLFSNVYVNLPSPLPESEKINQSLSNVDKSIFPYGKPYIYSLGSWISSKGGVASFHEDTVRNPLHLLLLLLSFALLLLFFRKSKMRSYCLIVLFAWLMFILCIPWQPWVTRLQVPLFALSAPLFAMVFSKLRYNMVKNACLILVCFYCLFPLFFSESRPLLYSSSIPVIRNMTAKENSVWVSSRDKLFFNNYPDLYDKYTAASDILVKSQISDIGLIMGSDTWEYPLWRYMRLHMLSMPRITHQKADSIDQQVEGLFVYESLYEGKRINSYPHIYIRDNAASGKFIPLDYK